MTQTTARIKQSGKNYEILVDLDNAMKLKKGQENINASDFLEIDTIFTDAKKGEKASEAELENAFGTNDVYQIAEKIVKSGEVLLTQDYRSAEQEQRMKQIVEFLVRNAVDPQTGNPHTSERIKSALEDAHVNIKNVPVEQQINDIVEAVSKSIPIKISTKKVKITIPAMHTGKAYGVINQYKQDEKWLDNGDLQVLVNVPSGMVMDFYDKLNSVTHGSALTEDVKEDGEKNE